MPFQIIFNNPLDTEKFDDTTVATSPDVPGAKTMAQGQYLSIVGDTEARTTYTVTVAGGDQG